MQFEPVFLSYAGLACLALSTHRLRRDAGFRRLPAVAALRAFAAALLLLACWCAAHSFGVHQGPVAFIGMLSVAGLPLVLLLSRWPKVALFTGLGASLMAFGALLSGVGN